MSEMSFDQKCYDLAEYFYPEAPPDRLAELAREIQSVVEDSDLSQHPETKA
jgi:hypothetical protein